MYICVIPIPVRIQNISFTLKIFPWPYCHRQGLPQAVLPVLEFHMTRVVWHVFLCLASFHEHNVCKNSSICYLQQQFTLKFFLFFFFFFQCQSLSHVQLFATLWTVACQAPLSMVFSRQKYWSGQPLPSPGHLPHPGIEPGLLHCRQILYQLNHQGSPSLSFKDNFGMPPSMQDLSSPTRNRTCTPCVGSSKS